MPARARDGGGSVEQGRSRLRMLGSAVGIAAALSLAACTSFASSTTSSALSSLTPTASSSPGSSSAQGDAPDATPTPTPTAAARPAPTQQQLIELYARTRLQPMTLGQKVAELFMVHVPGTDPANWRSTVDSLGVGGLILMGDNIPGTTEELAAGTSLASASLTGLSLLVGVDEEGGDVARLPDDTLPAADTLKWLPAADTQSAFTQRAALVKAGGISVNFGVVADVTADPQSFIYSRVLGVDPATASANTAAAVAGEHGTVFSTLKHFPGHGETEADSHTSIPSAPVDYAGWLAQDAPSFQAGIAAGAEVVMFGHLAYTGVDGLPASLSPTWHTILRDDLGFTGLTVTDDMIMLQDSGLPQYQDPNENAVQAVAAGNDLLLYVTPGDIGGMIQAVVAAVQAGRIPQARIDDAALHVLDLQRELWLRQHPAG